MRSIVAEQLPLRPAPIDHEHARELAQIDRILIDNPGITNCIHQDLIADLCEPDKGRRGMSAEQVLRVLIVKQLNGFSYERLAFHLADSISYRIFCRFGAFDSPPRKSALQHNLQLITPQTLESIHRILIGHAVEQGIESADKVRTDCTVVHTDILHPTDSSLLFDTVRVLTRIMKKARKAGLPIDCHDHTRRAKRRWNAIRNAKSFKKRKPLYRDLLKVADKTLKMARRAVEALVLQDGVQSQLFCRELTHFIELGERVYDQTWRRVIKEEKVPAEEKVVSLFEEHTDIIVKDRRETLFGHKICLSGGASNLILDCVIERGNPADSTLAVEMIERLEGITGRTPREVSFDGGFASKENLKKLKEELHVEEVVFSKKRGLKINDMVSDSWIYKALRNFRAGIEGVISFLKRALGLDRCNWKGWRSFQSYVWSSLVSANLLIMARHRLAK